MNKLKYVVALGFFLLIAVLFAKKEAVFNSRVPPKDPVPSVSFEEVLDSISKEEIKNNLFFLASDQLEGRMSGKRGNILAAEFLKNKFESYGLKTITQKFKIRRMNPGPFNEQGNDYTENVYAYIEGTDKELKNEIVVVGAHMDHIGYGPSMSRGNEIKIHPGADDNASGTVALLELARCFSKLKNDVKRTVVFMAFSAEEMGLIGSKFYCENPLFPLEDPSISNHVFMLNMDMVGYLGEGRYNVSFSDGNSSIEVEKIIEGLSKDYSFAKKITGRRTGGSDHACFYNKKVPIAFLHTGLHPHYHKPTDTAERINYEGLCEVTRYAFELSWSVANDSTAPEFNYGSFVEMDLDHDHGYQEFPLEERAEK